MKATRSFVISRLYTNREIVFCGNQSTLKKSKKKKKYAINKIKRKTEQEIVCYRNFFILTLAKTSNVNN